MYLYILGRPHSGSTILNILLGNGASTVSVGQLVSDIGKSENFCSCGAKIGECPFWCEVRREVEAAGFPWPEVTSASMDQAHVKRLWRTWWAGPSDPHLTRLAAITGALEQAITKVAGKPVLCDSSKEATRALFLMKYYPTAKVIFLVRDPRSAVASHYWRFRSESRFHFLRKNHFLPRWMGPIVLTLAAASWTVGNLLGELAVRIAPERVLLLRYEDLRDRPKEALERISRTFRIDLGDVDDLLDRGSVVEIGHNIGGNQVRLEQSVRFDPTKEGSRPKLPAALVRMTVALCWPLMRRYGYHMESPSGPSAGSRAAPGSVPTAGRP
ncbi:MAG: sulfotransferase [Geminicoccaceae bacterium]